MAILENEVWVTLAGKMVTHYEDKGYEIPRYFNKNNYKLLVKKGTKILVRIEDLPEQAGVRLTKICDIDDCGKNIPNQRYCDILKHRQKSGIDLCLDCGSRESGKRKKENVEYENSFEYQAKLNSKEYLLTEFSTMNTRKPNKIAFCSNDEFLWNCHECKSEYPMMMKLRTSQNVNCPFCAGRRVNHTNCLTTTHPEIAKEWHSSKNGDLTPDDVTYGSTRVRAWWVCRVCSHEWDTTVSNRIRGGCPQCAESKGEKAIREYLIINNIQFSPQEEFCGLVGVYGRPLSYDFYLPQQNMLIEYQGQYHDGTSSNQTSEELKIQQEHDRRKRDYINLHNINLLEIWYWDFDRIAEVLQDKLK